MIRSDDFNFDEWCQLAKQDEGVFEKKRSKYIRQFIDQIPEKYHERIIGLQWKLDMERELAGSPLSSCLNMYTQMLDSLYGMSGLYDEINSLLLYMNSPDFSNEYAPKREKVFIKENVINFL